MKVLLTGSAGFIGGAIAEQLEAQGDEVVRVDLLIPEAHAAGTTAAPGTHLVDVRDGSAVRPLLGGVDVVCHQSAMVGAGVTVADLPSYASHNDLGTAVLLAAMHDAGVHRIVAASSMVVYGEGRYVCGEHGDQAPGARSTKSLEAGDFENHCGVCDRPLSWALVDEDARLDPRSSYAASKVATEHYLTAWARQSPGAAVALRYHNVYGPLMPRDTPYSGVAAMFRSAIEQGRAPDVFEDGGQMRDFVHVHDVARANVLSIRQVAEAADESFTTYNVASGQPIPIRRVAELVAEGTGRDLPPVI
ncbi:MAG: NAD-dependent epimerase/dehydratase family protein, partial [Nocardioidaceae bacterium]